MDIILLSILFPFRLTIFASIHLLSLCVPKWFIQQYSTEFNYIILLMLGLKLNQTLDYRKQLVSTQLIVFQHRSFADAYIINYINGPTSFVYRDILNSNIFVRYFINKFGGISVSSSTKGQTSQIFEFLKDTNKTLAIAPEDISDIPNRVLTNNQLGIFKTGAFVPLLPVQPILINFYEDTPIWRNYQDNSVPETMLYWIFRRLLSYVSYFDVYLLEECYPSIQHTPQMYREHVRNNMLYYVENF